MAWASGAQMHRDSLALDKIASLVMSAKEWSADTVADIALVVLATGRVLEQA